MRGKSLLDAEGGAVLVPVLGAAGVRFERRKLLRSWPVSQICMAWCQS